jgi:hypothetical protein
MTFLTHDSLPPRSFSASMIEEHSPPERRSPINVRQLDDHIEAAAL